MADKKIPLLTEVYQPKALAEPEPNPRRDDVTLITPELIARIAAHIKPRLEADIARTVIESVRQALKAELLQDLQDEVIQTQASIEARTVDFVDKTKADLKTELPRMYQASAEHVYQDLEQKVTELQTSALSKADTLLSEGMKTAIQHASAQMNANIETLQSEVGGRVMGTINAEMNAFQAQSVSQYQAQLRQEFDSIAESLNQNAYTHLQQQAATMQADALAEMRSNFIAAMPDLYTTSVAEQQEAITQQISQQLTEELQAFQAQALTMQQAQLGETLVSTFNTLNENAKQDLLAQVQLMQSNILTQIRATMNEAIPSIYEAAADEVKTKFMEDMTLQTAQVRDSYLTTINADLPAVQEVMRENIQHILATSLPTLENDLRKQLTTELQDLLLKVKFVLPR